jgi:hypothetical protein
MVGLANLAVVCPDQTHQCPNSCQFALNRVELLKNFYYHFLCVKLTHKLSTWGGWQFTDIF